ncbi:ABC transporter permease [Rickettsia amblyommatis]|uniref:Transport permease protein n=2 Tax=Rickettsia amblyommatis TaxID=33989 RepID=H8K3Q5_RICAG|nr:ABC transporter permease [Rickettsia amblyommatis]AFC69149.1 O-antigen export system permease protein RfbA [Rickettsia amblyommatis str. GAT-30V]ALA61308.1 ABC transporter permease [Rickettsia amblyommatis]ARD87414.1 ABC transporter permease [Rickettsia amblyommatis]KJV61344.1 ABC-2 type transporter family protein [Rickettsia amblyommatis str. Ac/Pa]KJV99035.1 ABC-2 type transporter family protein [Rickettsia amblyommatis str. Darkwater]
MIEYFFSKKYWRAIALLVKASIIRQNKDSFLGSLWSLIQPFIHIMVISYFFGFLLRQPREFMIMNLVGGIPLWSFIVSSLTICSSSLVTRDQIIKKVRISKTFFPVADSLGQLYTLICSFSAMYFAFILLFPEKFSWQIIFMPILILPLIICVISGSITVAFLTPYIRDIPQMLSVILGVIYWSIPIVYPYSLIPESKKIYFEFNPFFLVIRPVQALVIDGTLPDMMLIVKSIIVAFITVCISYLIYRQFSKRVIYYL